MTEVQGFRTDEDLFAFARNVLSEAGFAQEEVKLQDTAVLLAENEYCIVALAATPTMDDLVAAEPHLEAYLNKGVGGADIGPKIWDHCCPVKSRIESIGWGHRGIRFGSRMAGVPAKRAFFRIA